MGEKHHQPTASKHSSSTLDRESKVGIWECLDKAVAEADVSFSFRAVLPFPTALKDTSTSGRCQVVFFSWDSRSQDIFSQLHPAQAFKRDCESPVIFLES